ncbi:hypothetical protein KP509_23G030000 [Ceratopteris richardii]|uniref:Transcription initiation factor TFIID subunit 8 n=1 Tax=Ceratopteris richardii TaxID=49495 RepID=A0A8T2S1I5_CERRI|nr:hypothetical protein KP509_23G030000 [Ceratopteris richardii]
MVVTLGNTVPNDGGEGSSRVAAPGVGLMEGSDRDRFPRAVAQVAVAQICESAGFHSIQRSALEILSDIAIRYLCDLGRESQLYANVAGRTQSNALDVVAAIEDMCGASFSDPLVLAASSGCVKELLRFVDYGEELPFARPLPRFPMCRIHKPAPSFLQREESPPEPHIPAWLPAFPDPQTYTAPVQVEDSRDFRMDTSEQTRQKQKSEQNLVSYRFRLCTNAATTSAENPLHASANLNSIGTSPTSASRIVPSEQQESGKLESEILHGKLKGGKRPGASNQNPFLAPALPDGSKPISTWFFDNVKPPSPAPSTKKIIAPAVHSVLDAFRPVHGFSNGNSQETFGTEKSRGIPPLKDRRPVRIGLRKSETKRERTQMDAREMDEKKKRVEETLSQYFCGNEDNAG